MSVQVPGDSSPSTRQAQADRGVLASEVAAEVLAIPGVAGLVTGPGVEVATYYPGGKQVGVRVGEQAVELHLVAGRFPLPELVEEVRAAATRVLDRHQAALAVDVVVEDVAADRLPGRTSEEMVTDRRRRPGTDATPGPVASP